MESFPNIKNTSKVVVMINEASTGIVFDVDLKYAINDIQKVYSVFDSIEDAKTYISKCNQKSDNLDFTIYNDSAELIEYIPVPMRE